MTESTENAPKTATHDSEPQEKLRQFMNSGWGDIERNDLTLTEVGPWAAKRRDALSRVFPASGW